MIQVLATLSDRISPRGTLTLLIALSLWLVTALLIAPSFYWPLDSISMRQEVFARLGVALLVVPLLVAPLTRADGQANFKLDSRRKQATLGLLKFTGALVGFYVFAMLTLGVTLFWYYLGRSPLSIEVRGLLAGVPLFFSYVTARRIPFDRYKMFGEVRFHSADTLFVTTFTLIGPLTALFVYLSYWFLIERVAGVVGLGTAIAVLALWMDRNQERPSLSDPLFILLAGGLPAIAILLLSFFYTPGLSPITRSQLLGFFILSVYLLSITLLGVTLIMRRKFVFTGLGAVGAMLVVFLAYLLLIVDVWAGRGATIVILLVWFLWGRKRFAHHFHIPSEMWLLLVMMGVSIFLIAQTSAPLWANIAAYLLLFSLLIRGAYRQKRESKNGNGPATIAQ